MTAAELAGLIVDWLQAALKAAAHDNYGQRVQLYPHDATSSMFWVEPAGRWLHIRIHQPDLSVYAEIPVVAS